MKVGDLVSTHCGNYGYITCIATWEDDYGPYEMIELMLDTGSLTFLPNDEFEVINAQH